MERKNSSYTLGESKRFKWSEALSGFTNFQTKEERKLAMMAGMPQHVPYESDMTREWKSPFLFFRFFIYGLLLSVLVIVCNYMYGFGRAMLVGVIPFIIPLTLLIFLWELNIPHNISLPESLYIMFFGGIVCFIVIFFIGDLTGIVSDDMSVFMIPLLSEAGKLLLISFFLRKRSACYGLNGVLIGGAVGAGFAAFKTADDIFAAAQYSGEITGILGLIIVRIVLVIGCDIIWAAAYGGALALSKGKEPLKGRHFLNSLFLICFIGSYLLNTLWNYDISEFFERFSDSVVAMNIYRFLYVYQGKFLLLTIIAWMMLLFVAKKGVEQAIEISRRERKKNLEAASAAIQIYGVSGKYQGEKTDCSGGSILFGRNSLCTIKYSEETQGISSVHCEIRIQGQKTFLIDKGSTYGTFLKDGTKLVKDMLYEVKNGDEFYLASEENTFRVLIDGNDVTGNVGRRTNEFGGEDKGRNFYIACGVIIAAMFLVLYAVSNGYQSIGAGTAAASEEQNITGVWKSEESFDVKERLQSQADGMKASLTTFFSTKTIADGITITEDGNLYCTKNGKTVKNAEFEYSIVDDSTIHIQWHHETGISVGFSGKIVSAGVEDKNGVNIGYDAAYSLTDSGKMQMDFLGKNINLTRDSK